MPKPRSPKLESPTSRRKLPVRKKPYQVRLAPGIALAYRRNAGPGTWSVRVSDGFGGEWLKRIGLADDLEPAAPPHVLSYWQAQEAARSSPADNRAMSSMRADHSPWPKRSMPTRKT